MPSDLIVSRIILPSPVTAPCPNKIDVEITNIGSDSAQLPFEVLLEILNIDQRFPPSSQRRMVRGLEGNRVAPNQTVTVSFRVDFPCQTQVQLRVTADDTFLVPNNRRTNPQKTIAVGPIDLLPSLEVGLPQITLIDKYGNVTRNPSAICFNAQILVEVTIRNRGCADAPAFDTEMNVSHIGTLPRTIAGLAAGASILLQGIFYAPSYPDFLVFEFKADINNAIHQCPGAILNTAIAYTVEAGSAPVSILDINGPVVPGQAPMIQWAVHNDCSDLNTVQAQVFFGATMVFQSAPEPIGLRTTVHGGIETITVPAAIANSFWQLGTQTLQLRIVVTGTDPGPQPLNATFQVVPEAPLPISFVWANPTGAPWKKAYRLRGSFSNASIFSAMTITTASVMETEPTIPISSPVSLMPSVIATLAVAPTMAMPTVGVTGTTLRLQSWSWLNAANFINATTAAVITYTMSFTFTDAFGNAYTGPFTSSSNIVVSVSMQKVLDAGVAAASLITAGLFAAAAVAFFIIAAATPYPADLVPTIAGGICATVAFAALGISIWFRAMAEDPPLPDFDYKNRVPFQLPEALPIQTEVADDPLIQSLHAISHLLQRIQLADQIMAAVERKIAGARTDQNEEIARMHIADYAKAYAILIRSSELLSDAFAEFEQAFRATNIIREEDVLRVFNEIRENGVPESAKQAWAKADLPEKSLESIMKAIRNFERMPDSIFEALRQCVATLAESIDAAKNRVERIISHESP